MTRRYRMKPSDPRLAAFWATRRLGTLTTLRPDGSPHTVPVAPVVDLSSGSPVVRVLTSAGSRKARNVSAAGGAARVSICEVEGRHWVTVEGRARVVTDPSAVAAAEQAYAVRFRPPRANPERVVIVVEVDRVLGTL